MCSPPKRLETIGDSTAVKQSGTSLEKLVIPAFDMPLGSASFCLEVEPQNHMDFYPQKECRYFEIEIPKLEVEIWNPDKKIENWEESQEFNVTSWDPLNVEGRFSESDGNRF